ncbi:hypothetical protein N7448_002381 [Penicillium atrosanguineum]|uniref:Uncharacterized protein n=1 Tax=Penicillium atrosanguineum TaxID=1132637 RepID=A0A9W9U3C1_9EURO|nr:hypothetical protein N7526_006830 [Penicillium atrosanguineum]KAJ5144989.1 hypothetical protein N7448_002381 [Penicillium atrosanguineum]KAJ5311423.1 hypothetical protein N7476_007283 [Penicillium atrosanguineum]
MSTVPTGPAPTAGSAEHQAGGQIPGIKNESQDGNDASNQINWESEIQLVASLAKLQELERQIHVLRQSVPDGVLEPLVPISNSKASPLKSVAETPSLLRSELDKTARNRLSNIENFQSVWRGPELQPIWSHVEARIRESSGELLQPTGIWEMDYDILLKELLKAEKTKEKEAQREEEDAERVKAQSSEGEWGTIVEKFMQRNIPGIRIVKGQKPFSMGIALAKAGMILLVEGMKEADIPGVSEWQVRAKAPPGRSPTKLENSIMNCLNSRPRKWDLAFLLDMISSYADIKSTPCTKCTRLTNNAAQLPTIRRIQPVQISQSEQRIFAFDALHSDCA